MRKAWRIFLAAGLAVGPPTVRAGDFPSTCAPTCSGATLQTTFNAGPLETWSGANLACSTSPAGNGCKWCLQVNITMWNPLVGEWQEGGPFLLPPGPSSQSETVGSVCNACFLATLSRSWGSPPVPSLWIIEGVVASGACGSDGVYLQRVLAHIVVTS